MERVLDRKCFCLDGGQRCSVNDIRRMRSDGVLDHNEWVRGEDGERYPVGVIAAGLGPKWARKSCYDPALYGLPKNTAGDLIIEDALQGIFEQEVFDTDLEAFEGEAD